LGARVSQVAAGGAHALVVLENGTVAGWGYNLLGMLNIPSALLKAGANVTQVAAGSYHSMALTSSGKLHCWGDDRFGLVSYPRRDLLQGVVLRIAAYSYASSVIVYGTNSSSDNSSRGGKVATWGVGFDIASQPVVPDYLNDVIDIAQGKEHVVVLQQNGHMRIFGHLNSSNQASGLEKRCLILRVVGKFRDFALASPKSPIDRGKAEATVFLLTHGMSVHVELLSM
jgi:alpha-tubulin suppressor-like RCC1 family protein